MVVVEGVGRKAENKDASLASGLGAANAQPSPGNVNVTARPLYSTRQSHIIICLLSPLAPLVRLYNELPSGMQKLTLSAALVCFPKRCRESKVISYGVFGNWKDSYISRTGPAYLVTEEEGGQIGRRIAGQQFLRGLMIEMIQYRIRAAVNESLPQIPQRARRLSTSHLLTV